MASPIDEGMRGAKENYRGTKLASYFSRLNNADAQSDESVLQVSNRPSVSLQSWKFVDPLAKIPGS